MSADSTPAERRARLNSPGQWGEVGSVDHLRYSKPLPPHSRRFCYCGCGGMQSHAGMANGVALEAGCELSIRRWVRNSRTQRIVRSDGGAA